MARTAAILARISALLVVASAVWLGARGEAAAESPFANWAAVVISGDYHAHGGGRSEAFDNARRDVADALIKIGFSKDHIAQFSSRPGDLPPGVKLASVPVIAAEFNRLAAESTEGCLVYFSSHGAPGLVMLRDEPLTASGLARLIDDACGLDRPTVVIVSACFSGSLIPTLSAPQRLILTAARPDRSSFGCSESDKYPYFDACILETLPTVDDFMALGRATRGCVAAKEKAGNLSPASEPQMAIGAAISPTLPFYSFGQH